MHEIGMQFFFRWFYPIKYDIFEFRNMRTTQNLGNSTHEMFLTEDEKAISSER
jgi:hypothetical protein